MAIQALQPRVKEIQEKYKGRDPQEAQVIHNSQCRCTEHLLLRAIIALRFDGVDTLVYV